ncbi:MAG: protein-glutamate O-methyltransferase CheR [Candidatus Acidiferrum sp.]
MAIDSSEFEYVCTLMREQSAIRLEPGKEYLVESRLNQLARREGLASLKALIDLLRNNPTGGLRRKVVEAMVTTETTFFRDARSFEVLRTAVLPDLFARRGPGQSLNLWCAASAEGQEPYSIAMLLRESFPVQSAGKINFIASDISHDMLARAREGLYSQHQVSRGLPAKLLVKYFQKTGRDWQVRSDIRHMLEFRDINLCKSWQPLPRMDIIFMRNVLIYFDLPMRINILERVQRLLNPDGYLFLGSSESTISFAQSFEPIDHDIAGCFRLKALQPT